jgi:hypothetical protein
LITGSAETHALAAKLFANLADPRFKPPVPKAKLHRATSSRAQQRSAAEAAQLPARQLVAAAAAHEDFGWPLLAAAAVGQLDAEALAELQIAWKSPGTTELLDGRGAGIALRSLWILCEASRALPDEPELRALAAAARQQSADATGRTLLALQQNPDDIEAFGGVLYAALAFSADTEFRDQAFSCLARNRRQDSPLAGARTLATALLAEPGSIQADALTQLVSSDLVAGQDMLVLAALACRRAGGDAWATFRAESPRLLAASPLPGSVTVLVSRLSNPLLPIVAAR